jgi:L-threonylcarbamoyladenylate synthase
MPALDGGDRADVAKAAQMLAGGAVVAFPTETVYGLGARADDDDAVQLVFSAKGRPADHPLIVHVVGPAQAAHFARDIGKQAQALMDRFWPGPLTLIVPRAPGVATAAAGGQDSIGLRSPSHPVARALLEEAARLGVPGVAGPSANLFGRVSPTCAAHVLQEFGAGMPVLDGGACPVGIESTIVDCSRDPPALLRPGQITAPQIEAVLGGRLQPPGPGAPRAPGSLESHYAPSAAVRLLDAAEIPGALTALAAPVRGKVAVYSQSTPGVGGLAGFRPMPSDPAAVARELFAVLRAFDDEGAGQIWVERPPAGPAWEGIHDRLRRAAAA